MDRRGGSHLQLATQTCTTGAESNSLLFTDIHTHTHTTSVHPTYKHAFRLIAHTCAHNTRTHTYTNYPYACTHSTHMCTHGSDTYTLHRSILCTHHTGHMSHIPHHHRAHKALFIKDRKRLLWAGCIRGRLLLRQASLKTILINLC